MTKINSRIEDAVVNPELTERRFVFNGDTKPQESRTVSRTNTPVKRRKRSPLNLITILLIVSLSIVFYVWNKIMVNHLVIEVADLQNQYEKILNTNEFLRAEINKKSNLERIVKIATEQLGMVAPKEQPVWFEVKYDVDEQ